MIINMDSRMMLEMVKEKRKEQAGKTKIECASAEFEVQRDIEEERVETAKEAKSNTKGKKRGTNDTEK
jgi:hypothetical protein